MVRLVCIDVDGTLIGSSGDVLPAVWDALDDARASGLRLAICSGRPAFGKTRALAERLDPDGLHVFQNGASILDLGRGGSVSEALPAPAVSGLVARARAKRWLLELYSDVAYAFEGDPVRASRHAALLGVDPPNLTFDTLTGPLVRAQWVLPASLGGEAVADDAFGLEVWPAGSPAMPDTAFVSLTAKGVGKASAIARVATEYGFSLSDVMMVGDGDNDVPAMKIAGRSVAMGNADASVRGAAGHVVPPVDEGGLVQALALARRPWEPR